MRTSKPSRVGLTLFALFNLVAGLAFALPPTDQVTPGSPDRPLATVVSRWACTPPAIDGLAPHHEWGTAPSVPFPNGQIYFLNDASYLYILMDVVGDTVDDLPLPIDPWGDYPWITFDVNRDGNITPNVDVNYALIPGTYTLGLQYYLGPNSWTGLGATGALFGPGFQPSFASPIAHRLWEFAIPLGEIGGSPGAPLRAGFRAYSQTPPFIDDLPADFTIDFTNLVEIQLTEAGCNVALTKSVAPSIASPGDILNYRIDYLIGGGTNYTNVTIHDALPAGVTYLPGSASPPATYTGGVLTWNLGNLPGGTAGYVTYQVLVNREACRRQPPIINWASLAADSPFIHIYSNAAYTEIICRPLEFPTDDPPYAESEITVDPYPLVVGQPTKLCTTIDNTSNMTQTVTVDFALANFGIGLPFTSLAVPGNPRVVVIPPHSNTTVCIIWTPTTPGHQCVQVTVTDVHQQFPPMFSQRNLDVSEILQPGVPATFQVPVFNSTDHFFDATLVVRNNCPGWQVAVNPPSFGLAPGQQQFVDVTVTPPTGGVLGSGCTIDIEAWEIDPQSGALIRLVGGIRKIDDPIIPLGDPGERPFAEKEIRINPYPLVSGALTEVCVTLENNTDTDQTATVEFSLSSLGIGLAFNRINAVGGNNPQTVVVPAHSTMDVCITFLPSTPGHHCLAVQLTLPNGYVARSYRNLDVAELLEPGLPTDVPIPVGNPTAAVADIDLVVDNTCPGWVATVAPATLWAVAPHSTDIRTAILTVVPPPGGLLGSGCHIDLLAYINGQLIGGVRKIDRPPTAPPFDEPHWAESEITVNPDPPVVGQPTGVCVTLVNPMPVAQTVDVTFAYADFGAGVPFTNIQTVYGVVMPPSGTTTTCITWTPAPGGTLHRCLRVQLEQFKYEDVWSQRNIDLVELPIGELLPGVYLDLPPFVLHNPDPDPAGSFFDVFPMGLDGFDLELIDSETGMPLPPGEEIILPGMGEHSFFLRVREAAKAGAQAQAGPPQLIGKHHYVDVIPYLNGQPLMVDGVQSAVRFEIHLPRVFLPLVFRNF